MSAIIYLIPALLDWMLFFALFAVFYAAGLRGFSMQDCGWLGILFQTAYMFSSFISGTFITQGNAKRVLLLSTIACATASIFVLVVEAFYLLAIGLLLFGMAAAFFFNSFQAFMRGEAAVGTLKTSVAVYTLSWSLGAALGNVTAGWLYQWGVWVLNSAVIAATVLILFMLTRPVKSKLAQEALPEQVEQGTCLKYPVADIYIAIGWLMIFTVTFIQRPLFTFLPPLFAAQGISSLWASLPLFMHMAVAACFGLAMCFFRDYLYRKTPFFIMQCGGVLALCAMWWWPTYWICFAMMCLLGIYAGFVYYCAVYYASNSGRRSLNIGVNEALVGFGSIAGIVLGNWWMEHSGVTTQLYLVCAAGLVASVVAQIILARRPRMR